MEVIQVDLNKDYTQAIERAVFVLKEGGVVVFPTDTLYGLATNALDPQAVRSIFKIKGRPESKPIPVIVRNIRWAQELVHIKPSQHALLEKVWPGKVTVVFPKKGMIPDEVTVGFPSVALRVPNYLLVDALLEKFGYPLAMTSANISGQEPSQNIDDIVASFSGQKYRPDLVIDVGTLPQSEPSTILDCTADKPKILRIGAAKPERVLELLELAQ